ncbi:ubiquinone biosynthesis O-methyltransferase, mitochondrial [Electrophorus electricus]|uniref:Ubiquinone biosynthesis O-methyltransferase, mitochondrial n=1 Tax=Electrophorus electricus TaxID=8005 RepID=A0A4W4EHZ0_ELEEL|nr:ubiquinone biosynthesis O-methyltransferase, mitochondrial [Electrophorus electricus]
MYCNTFGRFACRVFRESRFQCPMNKGQGTMSKRLATWTSCKHYKQFLERHLSNLKFMGVATRLVQHVRTVSHSTLDPAEVRKFQAMANKWWDLQGDFAALHSLNDLRVPFIRDNLLNVHSVHPISKPLAGLRILDVGCGGGLLTEPLGRLGAVVLGIDPVEDNVRIAELHASHDPVLQDHVQYRACTLEELADEEEEHFDAVLASEVLEHLADLDTFIHCCHCVLKPGGSLFITTINRTQLSYVSSIVLAEWLLRIVPGGTHDWDKFITPVELERLLESSGFCVESLRGMFYNPACGAWSWQKSTAVNYALHALKQRAEPQQDHIQPESDGLDASAHTDGPHQYNIRTAGRDTHTHTT